jgi:hypothetical protein
VAPSGRPAHQTLLTHYKLMNQNHRRAAPAIDPTKKSSLFEVPLRRVAVKCPRSRSMPNLITLNAAHLKVIEPTDIVYLWRTVSNESFAATSLSCLCDPARTAEMHGDVQARTTEITDGQQRHFEGTSLTHGMRKIRWSAVRVERERASENGINHEQTSATAPNACSLSSCASLKIK